MILSDISIKRPVFATMMMVALVVLGIVSYQRLAIDEYPSYASNMLPGSLLAGLGVAMVIPHLTSAAVQNLPADEFAVGSAVNQAVRQFGATFGVALTVALLAGATSADALDHFHRIWWLLLGSGVLTSVAALALPRPAARIAPAPATALAVGADA